MAGRVRRLMNKTFFIAAMIILMINGVPCKIVAIMLMFAIYFYD